MPKKRHSTLYSKPPSTVHHTPSQAVSRSAASASTRNGNDSPSVNQLLQSLRATRISPQNHPAPPTIVPSLPAPIRQLLDLSETPIPPSRQRRRIDAAGRRLPAGPAPPRSWLRDSIYAQKQPKAQPDTTSLARAKIDNLPGIPEFPRTGSLLHACMKSLASVWEFHKEYDRYYLASLPTRIRMLLLSYIMVYSIDGMIDYEGLISITRPVSDMPAEYKAGQRFLGNEDFVRLDLSCSIGNSITFRQLGNAINRDTAEPDAEDSWDIPVDSIPSSLSAPLHLKYMSLSHPPTTISWKSLVNFAATIPTLTHLSLAFWPTPSLAPNSITASVTSKYSPNVRYGASGYYSQSLDNDWSEAANILRRLSNSLYSLEWLDLDGCTQWAPALRWSSTPGIDWVSRWGKVNTISLKGGTSPPHANKDIEEQGPSSGYEEVVQYKERILEGMEVEKWIRRLRGWINVETDEWEKYDYLVHDKMAGRRLEQMLLNRVKTDWLEEDPVEIRHEGVGTSDYWD